MTHEDLINLCQKAPKIGTVSHEEFVDYIVVLDKVRRLQGKWERTETAYMSVDGKVAMANEDHRRQEKRINFEDPVILMNDEESLTLLVAINSEAYGRRHGIATSRKTGGSPYEAAHPWEIAETSAIGRALSAMGYGVLPGSGMASAEDIKRARDAEAEKEREAVRPGQEAVRPGRETVRPSREALFTNRNHNGQTRQHKRPVSPFQQKKIQELFEVVYPDKHFESGIEQLFQQLIGYPIEEASYNDGRKVTAYLLGERRKNSQLAAEVVAG